ncbi:hypothetical protein BSKO_01703 [Bryopsis sp. KO-2023]|nr:hypothetical protein BSKO_01703 [Bryopsis sp. KO-2023]
MGSDDSKFRTQDSRTRSQLLFTAFVVGLLSGFVIAQGAYLKALGSSATSSISSISPKMSPPSSRPNKSLMKVLKKVAPNKEVLITISNANMMEGEKMLEIWLETVKASGVKNFLVVALDKKLEEMLKRDSVNVFLMEIDFNNGPQAKTGDNHAISAQKYGIIKEFLEVGWNVLLSDTDIAVLKNPFKYIHRDHDVESMTDGFDDKTAYGSIEAIDDPSMGWSRYAQAVRHMNLNSGLFYLNANPRTISLMDRLSVRLRRDKYWDQTAFNEEIFFLSHGNYSSPQVSVRVLDINQFMNSKYLFKFVRYKPKAEQPDPVMVHINYHPDKANRMKAVIKRYAMGDEHALDSFPGGSEPGS